MAGPARSPNLSRAGSTLSPSALPGSTPGSNPASIPGSPSGGTTTPTPSGNGGNAPVSTLMLRVNVIRGIDLAPKDRNGTSDPYLVLTLGDARGATSMIAKTLDPEWNQTVDLPILGPQSRLLEAVCWDKDRIGKDYMGEFEIRIDELVLAGAAGPASPIRIPLVSRRRGKKDSNVKGSIEIQCAIADPSNPTADRDELAARVRAAVMPLSSTTTTTDELQSELATAESEPALRTTPSASKLASLFPKLRQKTKAPSTYSFSGSSGKNVHGVLFLEVVKITDLPPEKNVIRTGFDMDPFVVISLGKQTYRTQVVRHNLNPVFNEKFCFSVHEAETNFRFSFDVIDMDKMSGNDYVGNASISVNDFIRLAPSPDPKTGLYPIDGPTTTTATRDASSATLAPEPRRKSFWPISRSSSSQNLAKMSTSTAAATPTGPNPEPTTLGPVASQLYTTTVATVSDAEKDDLPRIETMTVSDTPDEQRVGLKSRFEFSSFELPISLKHLSRWENKHKPVLYLRARYIPYKALRQQLWRVLLKQYDADNSGRIDRVELLTLLDALGASLHGSTIQSFFHRFCGPDDEHPTLSFDETVICLEDKVQQLANQENDIGEITDAIASAAAAAATTASAMPTAATATGSVTPLNESDSSDGRSSTDEYDEDENIDDQARPAEFLLSGRPKDQTEHVIELAECPICHQPRMNKRSDSDILVHMATCASEDWRHLNAAITGSKYVTPSQAGRKWMSDLFRKVGFGGYKIGANSANILVQDRLTGTIIEERMSPYVRLSIRMLYKGTSSQSLEIRRLRTLLKNLSVEQGRKFDDPASVDEIRAFVAFHNLNMDEALKPIDQFTSFNDFFYRELAPGARPCLAPDRPDVAVSPADCRTVVFSTISQAQQFWVKGRGFTISRLLGSAYPDDAARFEGGGLGIFRLAPQDYHRFHIPVDGVLGEPKLIEGEYYTVNPMAIRSRLDVYGENVRVIIPIDSTHHGRVLFIAVGAMMVGSTVITRKAGEQVKRGEELGYFKFGGSTVLLLFEPGNLKWDRDLVDRSSDKIETLVRVGMTIGSARRSGSGTSASVGSGAVSPVGLGSGSEYIPGASGVVRSSSPLKMTPFP